MSIFVLLVSLAIMISLDAIYLTLTNSFYNKQIRIIQGSDMKIKIIPVLFIYVVMIFGLNRFILHDRKPVLDAFILGFIIYAVLELTNIAIFDNWKIESVLLDTTWGAILFGLTTYITYFITYRIK
jgi:uncharacterized membrane protein